MVGVVLTIAGMAGFGATASCGIGVEAKGTGAAAVADAVLAPGRINGPACVSCRPAPLPDTQLPPHVSVPQTRAALV